MSETMQMPITIYTESTPNPESMKFVVNKILSNNVKEYKNIEEATNSPLAQDLFTFPFIKGVFFSSNFVTLTKTSETDWNEVMLPLKEHIRLYLIANKPLFNEADDIVPSTSTDSNDSESVAQIKQILETYVKPAVEMDGGNIVFKDYHDGVVTLGMQGSCSGCPSSTITLKSGIEGLLKRMMPEVKEVVAEAM